MTTSTPVKLGYLRKLLATQPDRDALRTHLHQHDDSLLKNAVLVTLHRKWSARPPYGLSEIGITTYDRQRVNCGFPCPPGAHAEDLLEHAWCIHLRIRSNAHLPTDDASPQAFHFGTSVYVTYDEARDLLDQIWTQPMDDSRPDKGFRPIICLSYGDNDALGRVRNTDFDFVPERLDTTIATLNVQDIAVQTKITSRNDATLEYLLPIFKIIPFHAGNAGNAAMYTTVIAFLSALRNDVYQSEDNPKARPGQKGPSSAKSAMTVLQGLMERPTPPPPFGVLVYCCKCSSYMHLAEQCPNTGFVCTKCLRSKANWRVENAKTHMEGLCVFK